MKNNFDRLYTVDILRKINYNKTTEFQNIAALAAEICETPVALITLLDDKTNHFIASTGVEMSSTPRDISFCQYTILQDDLTVINSLYTVNSQMLSAKYDMIFKLKVIDYYMGNELSL